MAENSLENDDVVVTGFQHLEVPLEVRPSSDELARRRLAISRIRELREKTGPLGMSTDELVHEAREAAGQ